MLYLILYYFLVSFVCFWAGLIIYSFVIPINSARRSVVHVLITGLMCMTVVGEWVELFFPVNGLTAIFILIILFVISIVQKNKLQNTLKSFHISLKRDVLFQVCLVCFLIMIWVLNAGPSMMDDSESYHIQMVKWIQEYGSVPGIANLHLRFGFNSSWFSAIGLLSYPFPGFNSYFSLNGLLGLWFCYFLLDKFFTSVSMTSASKPNNQALGCLILLIFCFINWPMIRGCVTGANYDFITTVCVVVLFISHFEEPLDLPVEWLIWPMFLFTVRMINAPMLLICLLYIFHHRQFSFQRVALSVLTGILFIAPFLVRNVILSGYPFFPVYQADWFSPDWKADKSQVVEISRYIGMFNRVNPMFQPMNETMGLRFPYWISSWYHYLFRIDKWLFTISIFGYFFIVFRIRRFFSPLQRCFLIVMIIQLITWMFSAPDPRFVQGPLLFGIYAAIQNVPAFSMVSGRMSRFLMGLFACAVLMYGMSKIFRDINFRNPLIPHSLPIPAVQTLAVDGIQLHLPSRILNNWNTRCYDVALPCLYKIDPRLEARGKGVGKGFRLRAGSMNIPIEGEYKIK